MLSLVDAKAAAKLQKKPLLCSLTSDRFVREKRNRIHSLLAIESGSIGFAHRLKDPGENRSDYLCRIIKSEDKMPSD